MIIEILKFLHLLFALTLFGLVLFNFSTQLSSRKMSLSYKTDYFSLVVVLLLFITASFLVVPKGYTFATPWINTAFTLLTVITIQLFLSVYFKKKKSMLKKFLLANYGIMIIILIMIVHDAVTKHTLWQ